MLHKIKQVVIFSMVLFSAIGCQNNDTTQSELVTSSEESETYKGKLVIKFFNNLL